VFYYGKDFTSKKQKLTKKGTVKEEKYKPLSVTKPGALGEMLEEAELAAEEGINEGAQEVAAEGVSDENGTVEAAAGGYLDYLLRQGEAPMTEAELLEIIRKG
jgi:hypothetical protein